jgi:hypothetical protein
MKNNPLIYLLFLLIFASCESMITDVEVPEQDSKLVIGCYLQPGDTMIEVNVNRSFPLYESSQFMQPEIENATVVISSSQGSITVPWDPAYYNYRISTSSFPILAGTSYSIEVSAPGFETVTGSTNVPGAANTQVIFQGWDSAWSPTYAEYVNRYRFEVTDAVGTPSYYRAILSSVTGDSLMVYGFNADQTKGKEYFTDEDGDLSKFNFEFQLSTQFTHMENFSAKFILLTVDEAYYNYNKSLVTAVNNSGNPFSEPALVYGNINKGLGIFGSYQKFTIVVQ